MLLELAARERPAGGRRRRRAHASGARRPLQDTLTAIRLNSTLFAAGHALFANGERHLRSRLRLARLYPPELLAETLRIAARCAFSLDELRYEYPDEVVPPGQTPSAFLRAEVEKGLRRRYPGSVPRSVRERVEHELALIGELAYEPYFLTVYDIVNFARSRISFARDAARRPTRQSATASASPKSTRHGRTCFSSASSPASAASHRISTSISNMQRREEVIQYLYARYGRERAALTAAVVTYRTRGALRDVGRASAFGSARSTP
jgi:error-prone DNA polymerase